MNNVHNNWRKFLSEGSYDESKLLREITFEELDHIEKAIHEMEPEDLAFEELFKGKRRIIIPFAAGDLNTELGQFLAIIGTAGKAENYEPLNKEYNWAPNWEKGVMERYKRVSTKELGDMILKGTTPKRVLQTMKIGKWLNAVQKATKGLMDWQKFKFDNDMGSGGRPMTDEEQEKQKRIYQKVSDYMGNPSPWTLMTRFDTRRDGDQLERLKDVIEKIEQLKRYWQLKADYIKKNPQGEVDSNTYSIIITRDPIDTLRMSDFDNITSCHSPPSRGKDHSYYHCAVAEAHGEGAVAYVVKNEDLEEVFPLADGVENITLDDYEGDELFYDDERDEGEITPISRLRLRLVRYYEFFGAEGIDIAVPEEAVKGERIPGFEKALMDWARENQPDVISKVMSQKGTLDLEKFIAFGGSYEDNTRQSLLIKLLGITQTDSPHAAKTTTGRIRVDTSTEDNLEGVGPAGLAVQLERDAQTVREGYNLSDFDIARFGSDNDEESAWIWAEVVLRLKWDADEWNSLPSPSLLRYIPDELKDYGDEYAFLKDSGVDLVSADNKIVAQFEVNNTAFNEGMENFYDVDTFDDFLTDLAAMERHGGKVDVVRHVFEQFMKREGYMEGGAIYMLGQEIQANEHPMYEWDWHVEEGWGDNPYELISAEVRMWLDYKDIPEEVVKKVLSTREFWLDIRKRMHAPIHEKYENKYYVDIEKFIGDYDTDEGVVDFKLNYAVGAEDPDDTVKIFKDMIDHWDDEDNLYTLFNTVLKKYAAQVADLAPMKYPEQDMNRAEDFNENKKVSGQQLFNNWRTFINS